MGLKLWIAIKTGCQIQIRGPPAEIPGHPLGRQSVCCGSWAPPHLYHFMLCVLGTQYGTDLLCSVLFFFDALLMRFRFHMKKNSCRRWLPRKSLVFRSHLGESAAEKYFIIGCANEFIFKKHLKSDCLDSWVRRITAFFDWNLESSAATK